MRTHFRVTIEYTQVLLFTYCLIKDMQIQKKNCLLKWEDTAVKFRRKEKWTDYKLKFYTIHHECHCSLSLLNDLQIQKKLVC